MAKDVVPIVRIRWRVPALIALMGAASVVFFLVGWYVDGAEPWRDQLLWIVGLIGAVPCLLLTLFYTVTRRVVVRGHPHGLTIIRSDFIRPGVRLVERITGDMTEVEMSAPEPIEAGRFRGTGRWYEIRAPELTAVNFVFSVGGREIRVMVQHQMIEQDYLERFDQWQQLVSSSPHSG